MNFDWIPLEKGTRSMEDVHALQELLDHDNDKELVYPPYVIDILIDLLPVDSYEQLLLAERRYTLTELFEQRHSPEKLLNYFKLDRVWQVKFDEYESNDAERILNKLYSLVVSNESFIKAYKESIL
jgi:Mg/Co/Ni transporter MgtE